MMIPVSNIPTLQNVFASCERAVVACSGGVDSMTLSFVAHRIMGDRVTIIHAVSAAVPHAATERVKAYAAREGWTLRILDAGEFGDENYMTNPANRCFFCKSNLYGTLFRVAGGAQLFSGTNVDDLGDWRPGLKAADDYQVRHPFVEANLTKADVRALASSHGLDDIAEMPSAPCLSSRIETGIRIDVDALAAIEKVEAMLADRLNPGTLRCRVRFDGIVIELDEATLGRLSEPMRGELAHDIRAAFAHMPSATVAYQTYARGSAFLKDTLK
jgi:uncharacterized protein